MNKKIPLPVKGHPPRLLGTFILGTNEYLPTNKSEEAISEISCLLDR